MKIPTWQSPPLAAPRGLIGATARRAVYLAVAALVVSCGDSVTAPPAARTPTNPLLANPDVIVMERTTDIAAHDGIAAVHRTFTETLTAQARAVRQGQAPPALAGAEVRFDIAHAPRPTISLPARYETAMCSALPSWKDTMRAPGGLGSDVEMTGVGDAPASTLHVVQDGKTVITIERTWVRTATTWQLERQVTTTADGRYRDVVTYQHRTTAGQAVRNAIPIVTCMIPLGEKSASPAAASRRFYASRTNPSSASRTNPASAGALAPPGALGLLVECEGEACYEKQLAVYRADVAVAAAWAVAVAACVYFPTPPGCIAATIAYVASLGYLAIAQADLNHCREEERKKGLYDANRLPASGSGAVRSASPVTTGTIGVPGAPPSRSIAECGGGGTGGTGDQGTGGGGTSTSCGYEYWEVSYDGGATWHPVGLVWTCYVT